MEDVGSGVQFGDWRSARAKLRTLREEGERKSWEVVVLGERLLREYGGKLGNEGIFLNKKAVARKKTVFLRWSSVGCPRTGAYRCAWRRESVPGRGSRNSKCEKLRCWFKGRIPLVQDCLFALEKQFPASVRVFRLRGMFLEASGEWVKLYGKWFHTGRGTGCHRLEQALELYNELLSADPGNSALQKRKVAIFKAKNDLPRAIAELNEIVKVWACGDCWGYW